MAARVASDTTTLTTEFDSAAGDCGLTVTMNIRDLGCTPMTTCDAATAVETTVGTVQAGTGYVISDRSCECRDGHYTKFGTAAYRANFANFGATDENNYVCRPCTNCESNKLQGTACSSTDNTVCTGFMSGCGNMDIYMEANAPVLGTTSVQSSDRQCANKAICSPWQWRTNGGAPLPALDAGGVAFPDSLDSLDGRCVFDPKGITITYTAAMCTAAGGTVDGANCEFPAQEDVTTAACTAEKTRLSTTLTTPWVA